MLVSELEDELKRALYLKNPKRFLYCPNCGLEASAHKGDYFNRSPDEELRCSACKTPLVRVRKNIEYIVC